MAFQSFYQRLDEILAHQLPVNHGLSLTNLHHLISPHSLSLPTSVFEKAERAIRAHYKISQSPGYRKKVTSTSPDWLWKFEGPTDAVLMAYDFHTTAEGDCQLVEVNTNASAYLLSCLAYEAHGEIPEWQGVRARESLRLSFLDTAQQHGKTEVKTVVLVDFDLPNQKMMIEFLLYQEFFRRALGWSCEIIEAEKLNDRLQAGGHKVDLVYNRLTDFYFEDSRWPMLKKAYSEQGLAISPHPKAYALFADKTRLIDMSQKQGLEALGAGPMESTALKEVLIPSYQKSDFASEDEIWAQRKTLFFKPKRAHGGKSVYRGESVSRKVFERIMADDTLIQKFVPAQSWPQIESEDYLANWRFDLRFFVYRDQIQLVVARAYQGQVTNFSSPYGGLTIVKKKT